ncbi:MAG: BCD family MFS transporter [Gammaproteobacteria bacterium]|nr:BCD family MFS transporter [Gammaproteobacteria bacterium]
MQQIRSTNALLARAWTHVGLRFLPFADAASLELPLGRLLRLALFQVSVGMAVVLLNGTLNRVMIVELSVPAWLVAAMISLPLLIAPFRVFIGFRSDTHRSALGWRRVPYIWYGTLLQFGGFAIMPFALIILSGDTHGPVWLGHVSAALAFLLVGAGLHTTQTAGLALATDLAPPESRPRVVALLYVMLLVGMVGSSVVFGLLLVDFEQVKLVQVVQGAAVVTILLNGIALWKQEARRPAQTRGERSTVADFRAAWGAYIASPKAKRFLVAVALGTAAFNMQDILLEPYGGEVLGLSVSATTLLTAMFAGGTLIAFALAARRLATGADPYRLSAIGALIGIGGFSAVIFAAPLDSVLCFRLGTLAIGFGFGLFAVGTLVAAMSRDNGGQNGIALGAWGAVQATAAGSAIFLGGALRDLINMFAARGVFGAGMTAPEAGYSFVYHLEIALLFAALIAIGPLVRPARVAVPPPATRFGLAEFPG